LDRQNHEDVMTKRFSLSIAAVAFGAGIACATSDAAGSSRSSANNPTNAEIDALETGVPASVDYPNRPIDPHSPTNAEINAAEAGNPDGLGYPNRPALDGTHENEDWELDEAGNPAEQSAQPDKR
jgi:hypothetical protein